jgi:hypothetical protein
MDTHDTGLSEQQVQAYFETYLQLKSKYNRVMYSLFAACGPQALLYSSFFEAHVGRRLLPLGLLIAGVPWLVYFSITFVRVPPPVMPRTFRRLLLFVMAWYVTSTVVLVAIGFAKLIPTILPPAWTMVMWLSALGGWLGVPTLYRFQAVLRGQVDRSALASQG